MSMSDSLVMAYFAEVPALLGGLFEEVEHGSPLFQSLLQGYSSYENNMLGLNNSNYQQQQLFGQQQYMAAVQNQFSNQQLTQNLNSAAEISGARNDTALEISENQLNSNQTINQQNLTSLEARQGAQFAQQNSLLQQSFSNNLKSNAIGSVFNLGGNLINTGINYLTTSALMNQQASLQRQNFDYTTGKAADALTQAGLPSWLAYTSGGGSNALPRQSQTISGNNLYTSSIPGNQSSLIWTGSSSQLAFGAGDIPTAQ